MNGYLKQSTASQTRTIGPFVDDTDFKTLENALSIANTDVIIKKNGAASGSKNSGGATADGSGGLYHLTWDATDTNTVGELSFSVKVAGALVVFGTYTVLEEAVYDMLFGASAIGYITDQPVNTTKISGTTQTARDIGASVLLSSGTGTGQISLSSGLVSLSGTQTFNVTGNITGNLSGSVGSVTATVNADVVKVNGSTITGSGTLADPWGP